MSVNLNNVHDIVTPTSLAGCRLTDTYDIMTIWHDGSPTEAGTAVTAATVAYGDTNDITLTINAAGDGRIGSSGVIATDAGGFNTYVEVYREINKAQGWHCRLEGVLGSATSTAECMDLTEISCLGYDNAQILLGDTSILDVHGLVISNRRVCNTGGRPGEKLRKIEDEHSAINKVSYIWITATDATAASAVLRIYSIKGVESETLMFEQLPAATTVETILNFSARPIVALPDEHLLVQYVAGGALTAISECMVNGKSVVYNR